MSSLKRIFFTALVLYAQTTFAATTKKLSTQDPPYVTCQLMGQLGNNLFQIAATYALAWENNVEPILPKLSNGLRQHILSKCTFDDTGIKTGSCSWREPSFAFHPIHYMPNIKLLGYFQSEKYFVKYRDRILSLFAPTSEDMKYIQKKYQQILAHPNSVGIQLRYYGVGRPGSIYPQFGKDYLAKAMSQFSKDALFIVSSDNLPYARSCIPAFAKNVIFLEREPNYIDMYVLSMCTHNIISNSSFGWWAAWLNKNPNKRVLCPKPIFFRLPCQDYYPAKWTTVTALYD